jgi:hypothetical protein
MSTYLLFVGVGDFERVQERVDGVDVGVVVKRGDTGKAAYALEQAGQLLHYYNEYFGVQYPCQLDLIAARASLRVARWRTGAQYFIRRITCCSIHRHRLNTTVRSCSWWSPTRWHISGSVTW